MWCVPPKLEGMTFPDLPRVLVVDDDPDLRDLLATFGHKFGAPVVAQAAGEIEQPVDADTFMRWAAQFIERSLQAPASP